MLAGWQRSWLILIIVLPIVIMNFATSFFSNLADPRTINKDLLSAGAFSAWLSAGILGYILKERIRFIYGVIELIFALSLLWATWQDVLGLKDVGDVSYLVIGAALYVFVSSLENIGGGIRETNDDGTYVWPAGARFWDALSLKPATLRDNREAENLGVKTKRPKRKRNR